MIVRTLDTFTDFASATGSACTRETLDLCFPSPARTILTEEGILVTEHPAEPLRVNQANPTLTTPRPVDKAPEAPVQGAVKHDAGKARWDLLPPELMEQTALVLGFGATKYGNRNWEKGMAWGRPFAALMRHMWAWWRQENGGKDAETGYSHLAHAAACLAFLIAYEQRQAGDDDRPVSLDRKAA